MSMFEETVPVVITEDPKSSREEAGLKAVNFKLKEAQKNALETHCLQAGTTLSKLLRELVESYLTGVLGSSVPSLPASSGITHEEMRRELAVIAVLFLSTRHRCSRTDDAIAMVNEVYLSGELHKEVIG